MATDYRNTEIPPSTSSFGTPGALVYELFAVRHCAGCRPNFLMLTPTLPCPPLPRFAAEIGVCHMSLPFLFVDVDACARYFYDWQCLRIQKTNSNRISLPLRKYRGRSASALRQSRPHALAFESA